MPPTADARGRYFGFGVWKTLAEWARDPRCPVIAATLRDRVRAGLSVERAFASDDRRGEYYRGFGERKSIAGWLRDPRCPVGRVTLTARLRRGLTVEEAFQPVPPDAPYETYPGFGERKTASGWFRDPRCRVGFVVLRARLRAGMPTADALQQPAGPVRTMHPGFGTRKTLCAWAKDPRCPVTHEGLRGRVRRGLTVEQAFALGPFDPSNVTPPSRRGGGRKPRRITAWGETKTLAEWAADPRAATPASVISSRLRLGYPPEQAIELPKHRHRSAKPVTAWGETKTLAEWAADPRAAVGRYAIEIRLKAGIPAETAIGGRRYHPRGG